MIDETNDVNLGHATPVAETEKALLINLDASGEEVWIPKSVISDDSEVYSMKSGAGDLCVAGWWAVKKGLGV